MNAPLQTVSTQPFSKWFEVHPDLGISMMDHLFNRLDGAYPHKWRSNFSNQQAIDNWSESWAEEFEDSGITPNDIKAGIKACRTRYDWPPSCAEFIKACKPSVDPLVAYYEAIAGVQARQAGQTGVWTHRAIFWAAMPLSFDLGNQTYSQIKVRWERALAEQMDRGEWAEIPQPMLALPEPGKTQLSREKAAEMMQELNAVNVAKAYEQQMDHKAWVKKIMERERRGDKSVSALQVRFASEALGIGA
jgi:hypothetical protein